MDDATRLISDLERKLEELDQRVAAYREDMAAEFRRYSQELLQNTPQAVSAEVQQAMAELISNYSSLAPSLDTPESRRPSSGRESWHGRGSPPPRPFDDTRSEHNRASEAPGSPHEREKEFQGVFTPSYLPLLDSSHRQLPQSPASKPHNPTSTAMGEEQAPTTTETDLAVRPSTVRRATDETTSSVLSDRSDSKVRRSALRRSSSSSKPQSPRRVRFEVSGSEVLPSSSPQTLVEGSTSQDAEPSSAVEEAPSDSINAEAILGPDLEGPPPKKVSSTQALRALSRIPLDEGTIWKEVSQESLGYSLPQGQSSAIATSDSTSTIRSTTQTTQPALVGLGTVAPELSNNKTSPVLGLPLEAEGKVMDNVNDSSEEELLIRAKPKSSSNKKALPRLSGAKSTPAVAASPPSETAKKEPKTRTKEATNVAEEADEEDLPFEFEESASAAPRRRPASPPDDYDETEETGTPSRTARTTELSQHFSSPAVAISRATVAPTAPATPQSARFQPGSLGSYRGRPVTMPVVTNPKVLDQAESLGQFNTFVGGLDGRSGMDEGDLSSFRASLAQSTAFSGTPRSLTERMMMEEAAEANAQRRRESKMADRSSQQGDNM
jgi:hypothetical protein